ncbi:MAG: type II secretion system GspH family protein [Patescibacteria group bacterium]|nr:type II secretion system GspH family protein [Patescibacteria group bacterium]MCL5261693.1 type II secretion system GspH family protein [Patescibacteria group bacterium]
MLKNKRSSGFTLVEVVLVITFMALLLTITLGNFFGTRSKYALSTTSEKIVFDLRLAYENARGQKDGTAWGVRLNNDASGQFFEIFSGDTYAGGTKSSRTVLPAEVKFIAPAAGSNTDVLFAKLTGLPAASASITIGLKNFASVTKTITVNANGTVTY